MFDGRATRERPWLTWSVIFGSAALALACSSEVPGRRPAESAPVYDPLQDELVNPSFLFDPYPVDNPDLVDHDATLKRHIGGDPTTLNPIFNVPWQDHYMHFLLFLNPIRRNRELVTEINPTVVESWEESENHRTFTLKLRPEARWHDGTPWTAHDIAFSFEVISDDSVPALFYKRSAERLASVRALDDHTVEYRHHDALPTRLRDMSFPVIPKHEFDNPAERASDPSMRSSTFYSDRARRKIVGSGPYRFVEWHNNDKVVVERWDDYPFEKARFKRQVLRVIPDTNVALLLFKKGELDEINLSGQQFATQTNDEGFRSFGVKACAPTSSMPSSMWSRSPATPTSGRSIGLPRATTAATTGAATRTRESTSSSSRPAPYWTAKSVVRSTRRSRRYPLRRSADPLDLRLQPAVGVQQQAARGRALRLRADSLLPRDRVVVDGRGAGRGVSDRVEPYSEVFSIAAIRSASSSDRRILPASSRSGSSTYSKVRGTL